MPPPPPDPLKIMRRLFVKHIFVLKKGEAFWSKITSKLMSKLGNIKKCEPLENYVKTKVLYVFR